MKRATIFHLLPIIGSTLSVINIILYMVHRDAGEAGNGNSIDFINAWIWLFATILVVCNVLVLIREAYKYRKTKKADKIALYLILTSFVLYCLFFVFAWVFPPAFRGV